MEIIRCQNKEYQRYPTFCTPRLPQVSSHPLVNSTTVPLGHTVQTTWAHPLWHLQGLLRALHELWFVVSCLFTSGQANSLLQTLEKPLVSLRLFARIQCCAATCRSFLQGPHTLVEYTHFKSTFLPFPSPSSASQPIFMEEKKESKALKKTLCSCKSLVFPYEAFHPAGSLYCYTFAYLQACFCSPSLFCYGCDGPICSLQCHQS